MAQSLAAAAQPTASPSVSAQAQAQTKTRQTRSRWVEFFGLDARSLALFRFFISIVIIGDLIDKGRQLTLHFTDDGCA